MLVDVVPAERRTLGHVQNLPFSELPRRYPQHTRATSDAQDRHAAEGARAMKP